MLVESRIRETLKLSICANSSTDTNKYKKRNIVMCLESPVKCHCHLNTTLKKFRCYESPRRLADAAAGGLVIYRVIKCIFCNNLVKFFIKINFTNFTSVLIRAI